MTNYQYNEMSQGFFLNLVKSRLWNQWPDPIKDAINHQTSRGFENELYQSCINHVSIYFLSLAIGLFQESGYKSDQTIGLRSMHFRLLEGHPPKPIISSHGQIFLGFTKCKTKLNMQLQRYQPKTSNKYFHVLFCWCFREV